MTAAHKTQASPTRTFAVEMANAFARVVDENMVDRKTIKSRARIFKPFEGGSRLDTDAAAVVARQGLKAQVVEDWLAIAKLPKKGFYDGLHLSPSTLSRTGKEKALDVAVTERLVRQSELMVKAAEVFGEGAAKWMTKSNPLLGGETPINAATNEYGGIKVREILNAIEHGGVI